ncbi:MAG: asparagine synthase (glutamine-hydrolyzing) [Candidatus Nitrospinota bacterium M3_3B_026]
MCGIFGVIDLAGRQGGEQARTVETGVGLLHHRGPDSNGVAWAGPVCFGHTRLSIIDLDGGAQPMADTEGAGLLTYNGEVYNFLELRDQLAREGRRFTTRSDSEVVLAAYLAWGAQAVERFRGMFAFAAIDHRRKKAMIARDRVGKKPLFYTVAGSRLWFSSELEPLYRAVGPFPLDEEGLDDYLAWQYIPAPKTIYKGVRCLPPACLLDVDLETGEIKERRYWTLTFSEDRSMSERDWEEEIDRNIRDAVAARLVSDVPYGVFLSGGVDSSIVTWHMADILKSPVRSFSIGFEEARYDEMEHAREVARLCGARHHAETVRADSMGILPRLVRHYGQPFADSSAIPTWYVSAMAARHVKMALSGDGGDESFAGYNTYEAIMRLVSGDPPPGARGALRLALLKLRGWLRRGEIMERAYEGHCGVYRHFSPEERRSLLRPRFRGMVREIQPDRRRWFDAGSVPLLTRLQRLDIMTYLPYDILTKVDIASMAHSLEVRAPLLDHHLLETVARMPVELKLKKIETNEGTLYGKKHMLRQVARRRFDSRIIDRPKQGFGVPLGPWFAGPLREEVRRRLVNSAPMARYFDTGALESLVNRHTEAADLSSRLWNLLFLGEWMETHPESLA